MQATPTIQTNHSIAAKENNLTINLIFMEKGHTQNINNSVHLTIEKAKKGINIHHSHQWITLIETASCSQSNLVTLMD